MYRAIARDKLGERFLENVKCATKRQLCVFAWHKPWMRDCHAQCVTLGMYAFVKLLNCLPYSSSIEVIRIYPYPRFVISNSLFRCMFNPSLFCEFLMITSKTSDATASCCLQSLLNLCDFYSLFWWRVSLLFQPLSNSLDELSLAACRSNASTRHRQFLSRSSTRANVHGDE